jgi:hypothetical protein
MKIHEDSQLRSQKNQRISYIGSTPAAIATVAVGCKFFRVQESTKMPKAPQDKEGATPKKRTRKAATAKEAGNGVHAESGNGAAAQSVVAPSVAAPVQVPKESQAPSNMEEQIRRRAYEIYLERGGNGGSPEQDWLRAQEEIRARMVAS